MGRVIKLGVLNNDKLIQAILRPTPFQKGNHSWTIIDAKEYKDNLRHFIYGRLSKYYPDAEVYVVDPNKGEEIKQQEPNLSIASSPFIYLPEHSGIVFLRVPIHIEPPTFIDRFSRIIKGTYGNFFVECDIKPISDLQTFAVKLSRLEGIYQISANVSPPNPLFGPLWAPLKQYLEMRRTEKFTIQENSGGEPIATDLPHHVTMASEQTPDKPYNPPSIPIGDAAILMAADGYGTGFVRGKQNGEFVVIRTSETMKNFSFVKVPEPEELFEKANNIFTNIKEDRHMQH